VFKLAGLKSRVDVFGGVLADECGSLLRDFFEQRRAN
jgi:tRNA(Arg) A34 adenosine deaminase TadA